MSSKLTNLFRSLLKSGQASRAESGVEPVAYKGYTIKPAAFQDGAHWVTAAKISKAFDDGEKVHDFVRADFFPTKEDADAFAVTRAKRVIDEQGDALFLGN